MNNKLKKNQFNKFLELFGIFKNPIIGIDIGSSAVKIIEIARDSSKKYLIKNFAVEKLNLGDVIEKNIKNQQAVINALSKAVAKSNLSTNLGCISIPNAVAISKIIQLEQGLSEKDLINEIEIESERYIPYEFNEVNLDFEVLGPSKIGTNLSDVLLVATKKENVNIRVNILEEAGINPIIIDIESLSIDRVFKNLIARNLTDNGTNKVIGLLDIGAHTTSLNVFNNLNLIFNKEQNFGGQQLLDEIQKRYGFTLQEAIVAMKYNNLPDDYKTDVLEPYRNKIAQQIVRLCQLLPASNDNIKMDYLCLAGGTSNLPGIDDVLQALLKIKVIIVNPLAGLNLSQDVVATPIVEESSGLLNCLGLALRNFNMSSV